MPHSACPIDIVYTWVTDTQPGYRELLQKYSSTPGDLNPNRTRDNLDILKYSLRSLEKYAPWFRNIYILTCRPQKPAWLKDNNKVTVIHHDEIIDNTYLPTFNSFCIVSYLAEIRQLSDSFLYIEDDILFGNVTQLDFFRDEYNQTILYPRFETATHGNRKDNTGLPPWNKAVSYCNYLLDQKYGYSRRKSVNRIPLMVEKSAWNEMIAVWEKDFCFTRKSRFRSQYNIAPEYLYPYFLYYEKKAVFSELVNTYKKSFYLGVDNNYLITSAGLGLIRLLRPSMYCLNDNFGYKPDETVVRRVQTFLESYYPDKSSFEK